MLSVPEIVEVRLVDASALADIGIWSLLTSVLSSAVVGFLVAFFQAQPGHGGQLLATTIVFAVLMISTAGMMIFKGRRLYQKTKKVSFRLGAPIERSEER